MFELILGSVALYVAFDAWPEPEWRGLGIGAGVAGLVIIGRGLFL